MIVLVCVSVCLSVCLSVSLFAVELHVDLYQIFMRVICSRGSVFFWRRCDMLCTSGFTDNVISAHTGPYRSMSVYRGSE